MLRPPRLSVREFLNRDAERDGEEREDQVLARAAGPDACCCRQQPGGPAREWRPRRYAGGGAGVGRDVGAVADGGTGCGGEREARLGQRYEQAAEQRLERAGGQ